MTFFTSDMLSMLFRKIQDWVLKSEEAEKKKKKIGIKVVTLSRPHTVDTEEVKKLQLQILQGSAEIHHRFTGIIPKNTEIIK